MRRAVKLGLFILIILVSQTVAAARLNFFGVIPDLILVSVVIYSVLVGREQSTLFAGFAGFFQDILSFGIYFNMIEKIIIGNVICSIRDKYSGDPYLLAVSGAAAGTAALTVLHHTLYYFYFHQQFSFAYFIFQLIGGCAYNILMVPILYPFLKGLTNGRE